ncbi:MAG: transposase [Verrucomicrobiales bacterium]|nr:transposase [Verrucomicrobiales bacterium]
MVWEGYLINEYPTLIGYLESGTYLIDNNLVENSIHVPVVGRRYEENVVLWSYGLGVRVFAGVSGAAGLVTFSRPTACTLLTAYPRLANQGA